MKKEVSEMPKSGKFIAVGEDGRGVFMDTVKWKKGKLFIQDWNTGKFFDAGIVAFPSGTKYLIDEEALQ